MKLQSSKLVHRQVDKTLMAFQQLQEALPETGWVNLDRKTLNMSLRQLGNRMSITPQSMRSI